MLYSLISSPCLANWANFAQRVLCHVRDCTFRRAVHFICIFLTQTWTDVWFSPPILLLACREVFSSVCTFHCWLLNWSCSTKLYFLLHTFFHLFVEKCLVTVYLLVKKCSHQFAILSRHLWQAASQWGAQGVTKIWTNLRSEHSFTMSTMMPLCQCQCLLFTQCTAATFQNAAKTKLESSLDVQTRIQFGRPNRIQLTVQTRIQFGRPN